MGSLLAENNVPMKIRGSKKYFIKIPIYLMLVFFQAREGDYNLKILAEDGG
jgi:hypothetical protein